MSGADEPEAAPEAWQRARLRVVAQQAFYVHAVLYVAANALMFTVNLVMGGPRWFLWPLFLWAAGLAVHAAAAFGVFPLFGTAWETRRLRRLAEDEQRRLR
ncbi:MAG: 2TM domain-containing protein [Candidatus Eiseniibacteriota bacterium]